MYHSPAIDWRELSWRARDRDRIDPGYDRGGRGKSPCLFSARIYLASLRIVIVIDLFGSSESIHL